MLVQSSRGVLVQFYIAPRPGVISTGIDFLSLLANFLLLYWVSGAEELMLLFHLVSPLRPMGSLST